MTEVSREPAAEALMFAAGGLRGAVSTAVDAGGVDSLPNFSQHAVGHEAAPGYRIEMQGFLVDLDFRLEANLRDGDEGLPRIACGLGFNPESRMTSYGCGKSLFTRRAAGDGVVATLANQIPQVRRQGEIENRRRVKGI